MNQDERCQLIAATTPDNAAKLVYQWVKTGVVNWREFKELYPLIDALCQCEDCGGKRGGVPGNENIVNGRTLCDYCTADALYMRGCNG